MGDVRGALKLIVDEGEVIVPDEESAANLRSKHPNGEAINEELSNPKVTIDFTDEQLRSAIDGIATGCAPGPDGLHLAHIKQMTSSKTANSKDKTFNELKRFIAACLTGQIPATVRKTFVGANLIALKKGRRSEAHSDWTGAFATSVRIGVHCHSRKSNSYLPRSNSE